jgi:hypothetical protein
MNPLLTEFAAPQPAAEQAEPTASEAQLPIPPPPPAEGAVDTFAFKRRPVKSKCAGFNQKGEPCKFYALPGESFCKKDLQAMKAKASEQSSDAEKAEAADSDAGQPAPTLPLAGQPKGRKCQGHNTKGEPCTRYALDDEVFCRKDLELFNAMASAQPSAPPSQGAVAATVSETTELKKRQGANWEIISTSVLEKPALMVVGVSQAAMRQCLPPRKQLREQSQVRSARRLEVQQVGEAAMSAPMSSLSRWGWEGCPRALTGVCVLGGGAAAASMSASHGSSFNINFNEDDSQDEDDLDPCGAFQVEEQLSQDGSEAEQPEPTASEVEQAASQPAAAAAVKASASGQPALVPAAAFTAANAIAAAAAAAANAITAAAASFAVAAARGE